MRSAPEVMPLILLYWPTASKAVVGSPLLMIYRPISVLKLTSSINGSSHDVKYEVKQTNTKKKTKKKPTKPRPEKIKLEDD